MYRLMVVPPRLTSPASSLSGALSSYRLPHGLRHHQNHQHCNRISHVHLRLFRTLGGTCRMTIPRQSWQNDSRTAATLSSPRGPSPASPQSPSSDVIRVLDGNLSWAALESRPSTSAHLMSRRSVHARYFSEGTSPPKKGGAESNEGIPTSEGTDVPGAATDSDSGIGHESEVLDGDDSTHHALSSLKHGDPSLYRNPIVIRMPDMSDSDNLHNTIERWYKRPGDVVKFNDILCDISTPDFTFGMVIEDEEDGILAEIHAEEGRSVPDGKPICTIYHFGEGHDGGSAVDGDEANESDDQEDDDEEDAGKGAGVNKKE